MRPWTRRGVLTGGGSVVAAALAGCSTRSDVQEGASDPATGSRSEATGVPSTVTRTPTPRSGGLLLPSLDVAGSPGRLVPLRPPERAVLLDFFATWCPPCAPEMTHLRAVRERYDPDELSVVSITQETDEAAVESFWEAHEGTWPVVLDPGVRAGQRFGITSLPTILVLAPDGTEVERRTGLVREPALVEAVDTALDGADTG